MAPASHLRLRTDDGRLIAARVEVADSIWRRFLGLMGRPGLDANEGLLLRPCSSIHMFFMRFPLDAVFVDGDGRVLRLYGSLRPWRVTRVVRKAKACFELPAGTCASLGLQPGDSLQLDAAQATAEAAAAG